MHLDDLQLKTVTFEIRYDRNLMLWDRAGTVWTLLLQKFPDVKINKAVPNEMSAQSPKLRLSSGVEKAAIIAIKPSGMPGDFVEAASTFASVLIDTLELTSFSRLGFRVIYGKEYESRAASTEAMLNLRRLNNPSGKYFGIEDGVFMDPEYTLRVEGATVGVSVRIKSQETTLNIDLPPEMENESLKSKSETRNEFLYDIDYYTVGQVLKSQLRVSTWLEDAYRVVRRDSKAFLEA